MHSSARGAAARMVFHSLSSAARLSLLNATRYSSMVLVLALALVLDLGPMASSPCFVTNQAYASYDRPAASGSAASGAERVCSSRGFGGRVLRSRVMPTDAPWRLAPQEQYCPGCQTNDHESKSAAETVGKAWMSRLTAPSGDNARHARRICKRCECRGHNRAGPIGVERGWAEMNDHVARRNAGEHEKTDPRWIYSCHGRGPNKAPRRQAHESQDNDEGSPTESFGERWMGRAEVEHVAHGKKSDCRADADR